MLNFGSPLVEDRWWREGSAEYFSNVVYPEFDNEHERIVNFDPGSTSNPLTEMDYENAIFFQYLANRRGNAAVLDLLSAAAGGSGETALRSLDGADDLWQEFVVAAVAGAVSDPGGDAWPRLKKGTGRKRISAVGEVRFETRPFVATRYLVEYEKEKRFVQTAEQEPLHASVEVDEVTNVEAWTRLPPEIRSECKEPDKRILVTTSIESEPLPVKVATVEKASCDPCVLGAWQMDLLTFETYMMGVFEAIGGLPAGVEFEMLFTGAYYAEFEAEGNQARFVRQPLNIVLVAAGAPPIVTTVDGTDTARYTADGEKLSVTGLSGTASADGVVVLSDDLELGASLGPFNMDGPDSGSASYTCEGDVLVTTDDLYGSITFNRIDRIPEPEEVTVETGQPGE